jgi:pyrroloquinoline quinone (PQQ) biosynthesis protein C
VTLSSLSHSIERSVGSVDRAPLLVWDIRVAREAGAVIVDAESRDFELRFEASQPERILALLALFDGRRTLAQAAAQAGVPEPEARACAGHLVESGLAVTAAASTDRDLEPEAFVSFCRALYPPLKRRLFSHPLWSGLAAGEASHAVFMGWLIENYHFIDGVNDRLALAVTACPDPRIKPFFVKHYVEEWDHSSYFMQALGDFGMTPDEVRATRPLPGTLAALNHMRRSARRDPLEYAACSGFLESTNEDRSVGVGFLGMLQDHYGKERPRVLAPLIEHLHLDEAYQHNTVLEDICLQIDRISFDRATSALTAAVVMVETMETWSTDILRCYDRPSFQPRKGLQGYRPAGAPTTR